MPSHATLWSAVLAGPAALSSCWGRVASCRRLWMSVGWLGLAALEASSGPAGETAPLCMAGLLPGRPGNVLGVAGVTGKADAKVFVVFHCFANVPWVSSGQRSPQTPCLRNGEIDFTF